MTFQYRVMRHRNKLNAEFVANMRKKEPDYPYYSEYTDIREVYYKDDAPKGVTLGPEWVTTWTADSHSPMSTPGGDHGPLHGIVDDIKYYMLAMSLPILNEWELPGYKEGE